MDLVWTKREKLDFYRALVTYGPPIEENGEYNWELLKVEYPFFFFCFFV
jgi:hypothetical protein